MRIHVDDRGDDPGVDLRMFWSATDGEGGGAGVGDVLGRGHVAAHGMAEITVPSP